MISDAQKRAVAKYEATHYDAKLIRLKKGELEHIARIADSIGESTNMFIVKAIHERAERLEKKR